MIAKKNVPSKSHCYFVTSNNPQVNYEWCKDFDYANASEEEFQQMLAASCKDFIFSKKHSPRRKDINGIMAVAELAPSTNTFHVHHVISCQNKITFAKVQEIFPHSNIEKAYGNAQQNYDYIYKQGRHKAKKETQCCEPYKYGEYFGTDSDTIQTTCNSIFDQIDEMFDAGLTPMEIMKVARFAHHKNAIETAWASRNNEQMPLRLHKQVWYHFGSSGSGKTTITARLQKLMGAKNVCKCDSGKHMLEHYDYEKYVVLDEVKGDNAGSDDVDITFKQMLQLLDEYQLDLERRYFNKTFLPCEIHLTSIFAPENLYYCWGEDTVMQLYRRLTGIVYHWRDDKGNFREYVLMNPAFPMDGSFYKGRDALIEEALKNGGRIVSPIDFGFGEATYSEIYKPQC